MGNAMRVLQLPVSYLPWTVGGKEVFCHGLSRHLLGLGLDVRVALHQNLLMDEPLGETQYETVPVHVLPPPFVDRRLGQRCTPASPWTYLVLKFY